LLDQLRGLGIRPAVVTGWQGFLESDATLALTIAPLESGLVLDSPRLAVITETALFGDHARQTRRRKPARDPASIVRNLTDLEVNAPVVHEEHGVGRYLGLETLTVGDIENEYLAIAYAGGDKLYVPVASLALVSRYTGASPETAPLHKLGSGQWERARRKATRRIHDVAAELLDIYAPRAARKGHACSAPQDEYAAFAAAFPFEETPDQEEAIATVLDDMQSDRPMDRLVCGDVGFGKTEVAMRAAFMAVQGGKQVALLVPTTLLAQQHYQNFSDRFSEWPIGTGGRICGYRGRNAQAAAARRQIQATWIAYPRRGTPLRSTSEGKHQESAFRSGYPDADGHPHPAHAEHVALRYARPVDYQYPAAAPPRGQDLCVRVGQGNHTRGLPA
jgi:transcription-repair coupling factor (superfamily II helicase)